MGAYTDRLEDRAYDISPEDDNYTEELMEVAKLFCSFDEALSRFISSHGYTGSMADTDSKVIFIKEKFAQASVPVPRNLRKFFTEHKGIGDVTAFQFCFAFQLDLDESQDFLRKICLKRGFDCHNIKEAVYYFAIRNQLSYLQAQRILGRAPKDREGDIDFRKDILYTSSIIEEINRFKTEEELIRFFEEHIEQFGYNNATATKYVHKIWEEIAGADGLAYQEACLLTSSIKKDQREEICTIAAEDHVSDSTWRVYVQILGLDQGQAADLSEERSLRAVLAENTILHRLAEECFPNRQGIAAVLNGKHVSNELMRKHLIFLLFYRFWVKLSIRSREPFYRADDRDAERCMSEMNKYLLDAGYPELYVGNPYDWIFAWAMNDEEPLAAFRYYIGELFAVKSESR